MGIVGITVSKVNLRFGYYHFAGNGSGQFQFLSKDFPCIYCISAVPRLSDLRSYWELWTWHRSFSHLLGPSHTNNYVYPLASGRTMAVRMKLHYKHYKSAALRTSPLGLLYREAWQGADTASPVRTRSVPNLFYLQRYNCILFFL